jgi:hypothetical protein
MEANKTMMCWVEWSVLVHVETFMTTTHSRIVQLPLDNEFDRFRMRATVWKVSKVGYKLDPSSGLI